MSASDWWARKLGGGGQQPSAPARPWSPQPPPSQQGYGTWPPTPPPAQPQQPYPQQQEEDDEPEGQPEGLSGALQMKKGWRKASRAAKHETGSCPECGSGNYFSSDTTRKGGQPHCFDCGYPLMQSGSGIPSLAGDATNTPMVGQHAAENVAQRRNQEQANAEKSAERAALQAKGKSTNQLGPIG